jgi:hypothetical protein
LKVNFSVPLAAATLATVDGQYDRVCRVGR